MRDDMSVGKEKILESHFFASLYYEMSAVEAGYS